MEGERYYFRTVAEPWGVDNSGEVESVLYYKSQVFNESTGKYEWPKSHPWFGNEKGLVFDDRGYAAIPDDNLIPKAKTGDRVRIYGRIKARRVSKIGNPYIQLSHIRRLDIPENTQETQG